MITGEQLKKWQAICDAAMPDDKIRVIAAWKKHGIEWVAETKWSDSALTFFSEAIDAMPTLIKEVQRLMEHLAIAKDMCNHNAEMAEMHSKNLERAKGALLRIVGMSHSWVITPDTGKLLSWVHREYRKLATEALDRINDKG